MPVNYYKTAFRALLKRKGFSLINIAGLTLGLAATLLIAFFVWDEYQYDKFVPEGDRIYRLCNQVTHNEGTEPVAVTPPTYSGVLQREFPGVEATTRVLATGEFKSLFETGGKAIYENAGMYADSAFFHVFQLPFVFGSPAGALNDPSSIVLSREMATRYFGGEDPVGKKLLIDKKLVRVTGVMEKNPKFHLPFNYLRPLSALDIAPDRLQSWQWQQFFTYIRLRKGADIKGMQATFRDIVKARAYPEIKPKGYTYVPFFQPLYAIHLYSAGFKFDRDPRGNITYVRALLIIAAFIIAIACFNFINLATALSASRAKEVGVRKAIGAGRWQLIGQFIGETLLVTAISIFLAIVLTALLLPSLNSFTGATIPFSILIRPLAIALFAGLTLIVGLAAGFYPAIILSGYDPVKVLKAGVVQSSGSIRMPWLRHGLVVIQFTLSILLILSAITVLRQVDYLHHKDLGFNKEQILFFPLHGDNIAKNQDAFRNDVLKVPGVSNISIGYGFPGDAVAGDEVIVDHHGAQTTQPATQLTVDFDYLKTLGLRLVAGRDFSRSMGTDQDHAWIINETAVREFGYGTPEKAIGQTLSWHPWDGNKPDSLKTGQIIGVVKDFNYKSLYDKIEPAVIQIYPLAAWKVAVRVKTDHLASTITQIRAVWDRFTPDYPLEYKFLDQNFDQLYQSEEKLQTLVWIFTGIAIFVGCLGLFGLAAYTAESRRKEVGIRKILGASAQSVVLLLSKGFVGPVVLSLLIAAPISWYCMQQWLQGFAYRTTMAWWVFAAGGLGAILIALLTVSYQAIRAALANPVNSLRTE
jgi:putative ABC transport system permease protein